MFPFHNSTRFEYGEDRTQLGLQEVILVEGGEVVDSQIQIFKDNVLSIIKQATLVEEVITTGQPVMLDALNVVNSGTIQITVLGPIETKDKQQFLIIPF